MKIDKNTDEKEVMRELSRRIKQYRIAYTMTQAQLSEKSMVSLGTVIRFEKGCDIGFSKVICLLKALGLEGGMETLVPDVTDRPSFYTDDRRNAKRARRKYTGSRKEWKWGDEE